jgi:hypothetical protein
VVRCATTFFRFRSSSSSRDDVFRGSDAIRVLASSPRFFVALQRLPPGFRDGPDKILTVLRQSDMSDSHLRVAFKIPYRSASAANASGFLLDS